MSLAEIPVFPGAAAPPAMRRLRRSRRLSWMVSGWFEAVPLRAEQGGTACMTLGCPDDFIAVRLGFANVSERAWRINAVVARPSERFGDYVTPVGDAAWTGFTRGVAGPGMVVRTDRPMPIEVDGLGAAAPVQAASVRWTWTDWAPVRSLAPDPESGMRVLMLRALVPSGQTVTFANGQLRAFTGNRSLNGGHDVLIGGLKFDIDMVSEPGGASPGTTQTWIDNQLGPGTAFPLVQFLTHRAGVSGIAVGDSHTQGTSTAEQFSSFAYGATVLLGREQRNRVPFGMVNCAVGGLGSAEFFARLTGLIDEVQPSYAVLPGWTYNDEGGNDDRGRVRADWPAMELFLARLLAAVEMCEQRGVLPIVMTPFPRDAERMTPVQLGPWRWLRETLLQLRNNGLAVIDATAVLGRRADGGFDGTYLPWMSADQIHPHDQGHAALARELANAVLTYL